MPQELRDREGPEVTAAAVALVGLLVAGLSAAFVGWLRGWRVEINRQGREQERRESAIAAQIRDKDIAQKDLEIAHTESRLTRDIMIQLESAKLATIDLEERFARARAAREKK